MRPESRVWKKGVTQSERLYGSYYGFLDGSYRLDNGRDVDMNLLMLL